MSGDDILAEELREGGRELGRLLFAGGATDGLESFAAAVLEALSGNPTALTDWFAGATEDWLPDIPGFDPLGSFLTSLSDLDASKIVGILSGGLIPDLDAAKIVTGFFDLLRIPDLPASKTTSGSFGDARIPGLDVSKIVSGVFGDGFIPSLAASKITSGVLNILRVPDLDAGKITTGDFPQNRIGGLVADLAARLTAASTLNSANLSGVLSALLVPDLDANKIISGLFPTARIPDLDANKITSGQLPATRLADLDAAKIVSGTFPQTQVANLGLDLAAKAAAAVVQDIIDLGIQGATGASTPPTGQTVPNFRDALNVLTGRTVSAESAATSASGYLAQILAENNANTSGGISKSVNFVGSNDTALDSADWTTYLGNTTPSATFLTKQNNNAAIRPGTTDGTYRPHAVLTTQFTTDNQSVAGVLQESGAGRVYSNETLLVLRSNAAMTVFTYARIYGTGGSTPRQISIGYGTRSGTTWTLNNQSTIVSPFVGPGAVVEFRVDGNLYEVLVNSTMVLQWTDGSTVTSRGASYRYAGFMMTWSRAFFVNYFGPELSQFSMSDYAGAGVKGVGFRFYRTNTAAVTFGNLTGNGVKSPNGFYNIQQASANISIIDASEGLIKTPFAGWWTFEVNYLMGAAVATSAVVYAGIWTGAADPPLSITAKTTGGAGSGGSIDQHIGGTIGPIYLEKDTYVAPCMWAIDSTSRSAKGGSLQNDCSFAGYLKSGA